MNVENFKEKYDSKATFPEKYKSVDIMMSSIIINVLLSSVLYILMKIEILQPIRLKNFIMCHINMKSALE
jgi:hypothetical protein